MKEKKKESYHTFTQPTNPQTVGGIHFPLLSVYNVLQKKLVRCRLTVTMLHFLKQWTQTFDEALLVPTFSWRRH